ncbi:metal-dependent hydrolase [Candidatus Annandia pinicola]|uniref:metal-dependent hydrolase n=1 Tax=Candidatus Annandia pinicola TaxID=1345117 RepID=UPI001D025037|nr:metal-dependent hydrolase [Candidatus Annandia pinicola]UDG80542.1 Inner membrane protein YdjM [Candidatus Annandia pinicola]
MKYSGHFIFALSTIIIVNKIYFFNNFCKIIFFKSILGCIFTCFLPDLDHPNSIIGKKLKYISILFYKLFGHRGFTHSILSIIIFYYILNLIILLNIKISNYLIYFMTIGYTSHIIADMFTYQGVPLLWPLKWKFSFFLFKKKYIYKEEKICFLFFIFSIIYYYL